MRCVIIATVLCFSVHSVWAQAPVPARVSPSQPIAQPVAVTPPPSHQATPRQTTGTGQSNGYQRMVDFKDPSLNREWELSYNDLSSGRIVYPASSNAVERYLKVQRSLKAKTPQDKALLVVTQEALDSLFPFLLMAVENKLETGDKAEASRLLDLLIEINPTAPSITRLREILNRPYIPPVVEPSSNEIG